MTYFGFYEIFIGLLAFVLVGTITACSKVIFQILFACKQTVLSMLYRLCHERHRPIHIRKRALQCASRKECGFFIDFFTVLVLFLGYVLTSYAFFDGVFRVIFLLVSYLFYRISDALFGNAIFKAVLTVFNLLLVVTEAVLSVFVFLINKAFGVIIYPILFIMRYIRRLWIVLLAPVLKKRYLNSVKRDMDLIRDAEFLLFS